MGESNAYAVEAAVYRSILPVLSVGQTIFIRDYEAPFGGFPAMSSSRNLAWKLAVNCISGSTAPLFPLATASLVPLCPSPASALQPCHPVQEVTRFFLPSCVVTRSRNIVLIDLFI